MAEPPDDLIARIHGSSFRLVYEFTGAGSLALAWLHAVAGSSRTVLEACDRYSPPSLAELLGGSPEKSVSTEVARHMACRAYHRALRLAPPGAGPRSCLGVACTATIATDRAKKGEHRCCVAVQDADGATAWDLAMDKGARDRLGEEAVVARLVVGAISTGCGVDTDGTNPAALGLLDGERVDVTRHAKDEAVSRLLDGSVRWVTVHPDGRRAVEEPVEEAAVVSGAFNPLHAGHLGMAAEGARRCGGRVVFDLSVVNADKAAMSRCEIEWRLRQFRGRYTVVLTRAPLFREKAAQFPGCTFVVGHDTAVRVVDPQYYPGLTAPHQALSAIRSHGCRFLVAARAGEGGAVKTLHDVAVPSEFAALFDEIPASAFLDPSASRKIRETWGREQEEQGKGATGEEENGAEGSGG